MTAANPPAGPFHLAAAACAVPAVAAVAWLFTDAAAAAPESTRLAAIAAATVGYVAAVWLYVWPARTRALAEPLMELPIALQKASADLADLTAIRREYSKVLTRMDGIAEDVKKAVGETREQVRLELAALNERQAMFDQVVFDRKRADQELVTLRQDKGRVETVVEDWKKAAVKFARLLERTAAPDSGLSEAHQKAAARLTDGFAKGFEPLGLRLIRPAAGDEFDDRVHEVEGEAEDGTVPPDRVLRCVEWGFLVGGKGDTKAKVVISKAPPPAEPPAVAALPAVEAAEHAADPVVVPPADPSPAVVGSRRAKRP